jgi:hypothetical protein
MPFLCVCQGKPKNVCDFLDLPAPLCYAWYLIRRRQTGLYGEILNYEYFDYYDAGYGERRSLTYESAVELARLYNEEGYVGEGYAYDATEEFKLGPPPTLAAFSKEFAQEMPRES